MDFLSRRGLGLAGVTLALAGGLVFACSSNPMNTDGGTDASMDATVDQSQGNEAGSDAPQVTCDAGVSGACDIVLQNCGSGKTCLPAQLEAGTCSYQLECASNTTGAITEGYACNPQQVNPCVAGLECINGRCAKHCCLGDDSTCGTSQPEGFAGKCAVDVNLPSCPQSFIAYSVCDYAKPCEPFQLLPCGSGLACVVENSSGNATCESYSSGTDAGKAEKAACQYSNDCEDGLGCYGALDGGASSCTWQCYVKGQGGPYDSTIAADAGAGVGGCPKNETCTPIMWSGNALPAWLGLCEP